jgi:multicomponent Na+:H+ antiporter subunit G
MIIAACIFLVTAGLFFFFATTMGLLRFPDFYSRMHAAGKGDTLSSILVLLGLALYNLTEPITVDTVLVSLKIMAIMAFISLASPTATHAIIDAGHASGIEPWRRSENPEEDRDDLAV